MSLPKLVRRNTWEWAAPLQVVLGMAELRFTPM